MTIVVHVSGLEMHLSSLCDVMRESNLKFMVTRKKIHMVNNAVVYRLV